MARTDELAANQKYIYSLAYSRGGNGEFAATGNIDGVVQLYDMKNKKYVSRFASKFKVALISNQCLNVRRS